MARPAERPTLHASNLWIYAKYEAWLKKVNGK